MTFDNTKSHPSDKLSLTELDLYHLIMEYRAENGLKAIPLSEGLTTTAGRHVADTLYNIWEPGLDLPPNANLHSWSDAPYFSDHSEAEVMWEAPQRIGTSYPGNGFEISAAGHGDVAAALNGWQNSPGHNTVIVNQGIWANQEWNAIGIGVEIDPTVGDFGGRIYHVWFGREKDPDGAPKISGTAQGDDIKGTAFNDKIIGRNGADDLAGRDGRDDLNGGGGDDTLLGNSGKDKLNGGKGDDSLNGGKGADKLVFTGKNFGTDTVLGYEGDFVRLSAKGEAKTQAQLDRAISDVRGDAVYDHKGDGKNVIIFEDVAKADLDYSFFILG